MPQSRPQHPNEDGITTADMTRLLLAERVIFEAAREARERVWGIRQRVALLDERMGRKDREVRWRMWIGRWGRG